MFDFEWATSCTGVTSGRLYSDGVEYFYQFVSSQRPMFTQLVTAVIVGTHKHYTATSMDGKVHNFERCHNANQ